MWVVFPPGAAHMSKIRSPFIKLERYNNNIQNIPGRAPNDIIGNNEAAPKKNNSYILSLLFPSLSLAHLAACTVQRDILE
jgi:hypothetical protein